MIKLNLEEFDQLVASAGQAGPEVVSRIIECLVTKTSAKAGAFWNCRHQPFVAMAHYSVGQAARLGFSQNDHDRLLAQVADQQRSAVVTTKTNEGGEGPTIFFGPLKGDDKRVVELVFPIGHEISTSPEFAQELNRVCETISKLPGRLATELQATGEPGERSALTRETLTLEAFSRYAHGLHGSIERRLASANVANETRCLLDCDRVSVVLRQRGRFRIAAISGQPTVNRRSNTVQGLEKLANEVLLAKTELWYPTEEELVPQIQSILDQYLTISTTRTLIIQPIMAIAHSPEEPAGSVSLKASSDRVIAGIIYEYNHRVWTRAEKSADLKLATQHSGDALRNAEQHQALFLYPLWQWLGRSRLLTSPALLSRSLLALIALVTVALCLTWIQAPFYVSASGVLVPAHKRLVFPRTTGEVVDVAVAHGQAVQADQTLVTLRSEDLELRIADVQGRLETLKQRRSSLERNKFKGTAGAATATGSLDENLGSLQAEMDSLDRQAQHLAQMQQQLRIASPIAGEVITWDVVQKLTGRTVTPQNVLMEVADTSGPWQLELELEDRRIEHLLRGLKTSTDGGLLVKFTLAADPSRTYTGLLTEVSQAIQLSQDNRQMMRIRVDIDREAIPLKQARTGVSAKIYTGEETSLGYLWLHEIPRTLNQYVFFYFVR